MFDLYAQTRQNFIRFVENCSLEELNQIPIGYNNNIFWNFAHVVVTPQNLFYRLSGQLPTLSKAVFAPYGKGTKPETAVDEETVQLYLEIAKSNLAVLQADFEAGKFAQYSPYETSYGFTLRSVEDALPFSIAHEALHLGYAMAQKKALSQ